jgi:nitrogen fixation/metabolism regulation signal transduction histidine kinase
MKRVLLAVAAALSGISLFLLTSASSNTTLFATSYPWLLALNGGMAVVLAALVGMQLHRLLREHREGQFGSRLKMRLVLMFALMGVVPGLVIYGVSLQFVVRSIESWFDVRVDSALEGGIALGQNALDYLVSQVRDKADDMVLELEGAGQGAGTRLNRLREQAGIASATILAPAGQVLATAAESGRTLLPELPGTAELRQARQSRHFHSVIAEPDGRLVIRVLTPIPVRTLAGESNLLMLQQPVPESFGRNAEAVQEAYREYQQLTLGRATASSASTPSPSPSPCCWRCLPPWPWPLCSSRAAWLRRCLILAEGTQAVAAGDFSPRQALPPGTSSAC